MTRLSILGVVVGSALLCACSQDPPPQSQEKSEARPVVEATSASQPPAAVSPPPVTPAAKSPEPAAKPSAAPPAEPAKPKSSATGDTAAPLPIVADTILLKASQGDVTLSHLAHARRYPCASCHGEAEPGKFDLTKESAHTLCRDCHNARGAGPTACGGCHTK